MSPGIPTCLHKVVVGSRGSALLFLSGPCRLCASPPPRKRLSRQSHTSARAHTQQKHNTHSVRHSLTHSLTQSFLSLSLSFSLTLSACCPICFVFMLCCCFFDVWFGWVCWIVRLVRSRKVSSQTALSAAMQELWLEAMRPRAGVTAAATLTQASVASYRKRVMCVRSEDSVGSRCEPQRGAPCTSHCQTLVERMH